MTQYPQGEEIVKEKKEIKTVQKTKADREGE